MTVEQTAYKKRIAVEYEDSADKVDKILARHGITWDDVIKRQTHNYRSAKLGSRTLRSGNVGVRVFLATLELMSERISKTHADD